MKQLCSIAMIAFAVSSTAFASRAQQGRIGAAAAPGEATASSSLAGFGPAGAVNGERFAVREEAAWKGRQGESSWWWQIRFPDVRSVGAILQINGDHATVLRNAPRRYCWRWSLDGTTWHNLMESEVGNESRLYRLHRLAEARSMQYLRLHVFEAHGVFPTLREVEFYAEPAAAVPFPDWIVAVSTAEEATLPASGQSFIKLARACKGWEAAPAQEVWLGSFDEKFVAIEPTPVCAFLTGNVPEWCQRMHEPWRGTQEVLKKRNLPIWSSCGGAQGLAILDEFGIDKPWDCPRCRDPKNPKLPIYTHIGHTGSAACGDYRQNVFERGKFNVLQTARDPVFEGLPPEFEIMESHCGQIEYVPKGWIQVVTQGSGAKTKNQCLRVKDRYIYAAQFHVEMDGTTDNSRKIMSNFLTLAKEWGGYNPKGKPVPEPKKADR
jgi:hypothetical protein